MNFTVEELITSGLSPDEYVTLYAMIYEDDKLMKHIHPKTFEHEAGDIPGYIYMNLERLGYIKVTQQYPAEYVLRQKALDLKDNDVDPGFDKFWDEYHRITEQKKTDLQASLKYWKKLNNGEKQKALDNISNYYASLPMYTTGKPVKKARTYLGDKNFNDEFEAVKEKKRSLNKLI